jgi:hypothetical protein
MTLSVHSVIALFLAVVWRAGTSNNPAGADTSLCSLVPVTTVRSAVYFVGTPLGDTIRAGPGDVTPSVYGPGKPGDVYGQVIRIELLNSDAPIELRDALSRSSQHALLVPWGYDSMCQPANWSQTARFAEPGLEGLYSGRLRPRRLWVGERPTFDVFFAGYVTPYPHGAQHRNAYRGTSAPNNGQSLTAREYFSLVSALPTSGELSRSPATAYDRLREWASQNPELAARYPAADVIAYSTRQR